ncbi:hypothetical protein BDZ91DRAFT_797063 [Kalaharituber pfeilii]|nr:hypothetical protein BDZ91DRAFT_797063 [Kalaharituber pfeilii]
MESSLTGRKRKVDKINDGQDVYKPSFKLSKPVIIVCDDADMETKVKKVLAHIVWLFDKAQKPVEASQIGEKSREIKRVRSIIDLAEKSDTVDES